MNEGIQITGYQLSKFDTYKIDGTIKEYKKSNIKSFKNMICKHLGVGKQFQLEEEEEVYLTG